MSQWVLVTVLGMQSLLLSGPSAFTVARVSSICSHRTIVLATAISQRTKPLYYPEDRRSNKRIVIFFISNFSSKTKLSCHLEKYMCSACRSIEITNGEALDGTTEHVLEARWNRVESVSNYVAWPPPDSYHLHSALPPWSMI